MELNLATLAGFEINFSFKYLNQLNGVGIQDLLLFKPSLYIFITLEPDMKIFNKTFIKRFYWVEQNVEG